MTTTNSKPKITLQGLKYAQFASHETACFEATVLVDGKKFCHASNDGQGGPNFYEPLKGQSGAALRDEIYDVGMRLNPKASPNYEMAREAGKDVAFDNYDDAAAFHRHMLEDAGHTAESVFEFVVGEALDEALALRDLKRMLGREVLYTVPEKPGIRAMRSKHKGKVAEVIAFLKASGKPFGVILNELPEAEALRVFRANAE